MNKHLKTYSALAAAMLVLLACRFSTTPTPPVPQQTPVPLQDLRFADAATGQKFLALDGWIKQNVDASWTATSYQLIGNFYEAGWCKGAGVRPDCQVTDASLPNRDQHIFRLNTLFYPQDYPQVFGLGLQALYAPKTDRWGASFNFAEKGASITGDGWDVSFRDYSSSAGTDAMTVELGWTYSYTIQGPHQTTFEKRSDLPLRDDLARYLAGPEAMRDLGIRNFQVLESTVEAAINSHQVRGCELGPYQGNGIPPACTLRPLTSAEESAELERAKTYFSSRENLLNENYQEFYSAWMAAFPLNKFWP